MRLFFFFFFCLSSFVFSRTHKEIVLDSPSYVGGGGFFHNFNIVLGCLDLIDQHHENSLRVDFKEQGLYYEPAKGSNWWSYYFDSVYFPSQSPSKKRAIIKTLSDQAKGGLGNGAHFFFSRERASYLINRYIKIKPEILAEVECFASKFFLNKKIIGVHYRGSDKWLEANYIGYDSVIDAVMKVASQEDCLIFVATDEKQFLDKMVQVFHERVVFTNSQRSEDGKPLHYHTTSPYMQGREALIDTLLLAKSEVLFRTNSNLSAVSAFFNPKMIVYNLNQVRQEWFLELIKEGSPNELNR